MTDRWPRSMKADTAAAYCDLSRSAFLREVAAGRLPSPVNLGGNDHWSRVALDKALDAIAGEAEMSDYHEQLLRKLDAA